LSLVLPLLGLYAELYACKDDAQYSFAHSILHLVEQSRDSIFPRTLRPTQARRRLVSTPLLGVRKRAPARSVSGEWTTSTSRTLPKNASGFSFKRSDSSSDDLGRPAVPSALRAAWAKCSSLASRLMGPAYAAAPAATRGPSPAHPHAAPRPEEVELFGELVRILEEMIDEDEQLRLQLLESVRQRRDARQRLITVLKRVTLLNRFLARHTSAHTPSSVSSPRGSRSLGVAPAARTAALRASSPGSLSARADGCDV